MDITLPQLLAMIESAAPHFTWTVAPTDSYDGFAPIRGRFGNESATRCPVCAVVYWISDGKLDLTVSADAALAYLGLSDNATGAIGSIIQSADWAIPSTPLRRHLLSILSPSIARR